LVISIYGIPNIFNLKNKQFLFQVLALKNLLSLMSEDNHVHLLILATENFKICITQGINDAFLRYHTGRFKMFSVITNIYNKKTKGPTLMELFTATGKLKKFFFLTTRDVQCVPHG
jgi:hypothetical protein